MQLKRYFEAVVVDPKRDVDVTSLTPNAWG